MIYFLHIPKTGGSTIARSFKKNKKIKIIRHKPCFTINKNNSDKIITFIRNPYDRLVSSFFFLQQGGLRKRKNVSPEGKKIGIDKSTTFESFVNLIYNNRNKINNVVVKPQMHYIYDIKKIDYLLKFENYNINFILLCNLLKLEPFSPPKKNTSVHFYFHYYYKNKPHIKNMVYKIYKYDFQMLEYDKDIF